MALDLNEGWGLLFKNKKKTESKQPDLRGELLLNGVTYRVAAWSKESKAGERFMSIHAEIDRPREEKKTAEPQSKPKAKGLDDDIPF